MKLYESKMERHNGHKADKAETSQALYGQSSLLKERKILSERQRKKK